MRSRLVVLLALLIGLILSPGYSLAQTDDEDELQIPEGAVQVLFVDVVDGDTIDVDYDLGPGQDLDRIRLIGIDTPEMNYSLGNEPECYGEEATKRTESLLVAAEKVWEVRDVDPVDPFDRLLRYIWYVSGIDGQIHFLNEQLVEEGYALAKAYPPNLEYQDILDDAQIRAIEEGRGMWSTCDASVSLDPDLELDGKPDDTRADPSEIELSDEEIVCSFFDNQEEAQEYLIEFPELADDLDPDGNGIACDGYF